MVNFRLSLKLYKQHWCDRYICISYLLLSFFTEWLWGPTVPWICDSFLLINSSAIWTSRAVSYLRHRIYEVLASVIITGICGDWLSFFLYFICLYFLDGYNAENMQYRWENRTDKGVAVNEKLDDMPQYNLTGATTFSYFTDYYSGGCIADKSPLGNTFLDTIWPI